MRNSSAATGFIRRSSARRLGHATLRACLALAAAAGVLLVGWLLRTPRTNEQLPELLTTAAWRGPYDYSVVERGLVESSSSTEIRCQVRARGGGPTILNVIPEGSFVQMGDVLAELDPSSLLEDENARKILLATRESLLAQAENTHQAAQIAKQEYLDGLYVAQETALVSALFAAGRTRDIAATALESAKALHTEGIFTSLQVQAAYAGLDDARNKLDAADTALNTLRTLTKQKELALLEANIASAAANVQAQLRSLRLERERLEFIQEQIANCTIRAPAPGQVVYANDTQQRSGSQSQFIVAPGAQVRERQTLIWLPNPRAMQVKAAVNEARITMIRPGMPVTIRVAALPNAALEGKVAWVSEYADSGSFWSANIKQYTTIVKIDDPPADLRVGMNAEVHIHVERREDALQVPVRAFAESQGRFFSLVQSGDRYETREIKIGSANDQVATVEMGLEDGDELVLNPRSAGSLFELPSFDSPSGDAETSGALPGRRELLTGAASEPPPAKTTAPPGAGPETIDGRNPRKPALPHTENAGGG